MAYVADSLSMFDMGIGGATRRYFTYETAADSEATMVTAGYFSDGVTKGMRAGDVVMITATTGPKFKIYQVASVSGAAATIAAPTAIT